jgi:hypothetical protein
MIEFFTGDRLMFAFLRLGALGLVFGFRFSACFALAYYGLQWIIGRSDAID